MEVLRLLCVSVTLCSVGGERILAVLPFMARSHFIAFQQVLEELARRGHHVTVVSQFPRADPMLRYTDIDVAHTIGMGLQIANLTTIEKTGSATESFTDFIMKELTGMEKVYGDQMIQDLLNTAKFDLVMTELFITDMFNGLAHRFGAPLVHMMSSDVVPWAGDRFGIPDNPSYIRVSVNAFPSRMSLYDRIKNTFLLLLVKGFYSYLVTPFDERVSEQYLGDGVPSVKEMMDKASLCLVNSHFSLSGARPLPPQVVEIGGVHITPVKPLPKDIEKFINESQHGVIYFSFGSVASGYTMSEPTRKAFCDSFAKLKQRVLWKWELDEMPGKPENVKIVKWMPQGDVLAHPNIRAFISHGGLLGTMEAVHNAVPMIGIPLFGDQYQNIGNLVEAGSAVLLELTKITEQSLSQSLQAILVDPSYKKNAERLSQLFRDRPLPALDTAIYWIEYVLKHNGAHHLRTAAVGMPWYQYYLLDVFAVVVSSLILVIYVLIFAVKYVFRKVCGKSKEKVH